MGSVSGLEQVIVYGNIISQDIPTTPDYRAVRIDKYTRAIESIDYSHHEVHEGMEFFTTYYATVNSGANLDILVVTPNSTRWSHMLYRVRSTLITTMTIYEGTTTNADGTGLDEYNADRNSATVSTVVVYHTPDVAATGTAVFVDTWGIAVGGNVRVGGESNTLDEMILQSNKKYLMRLASGSDGNLISVKLRWYEHVNYN